MAEITRADVLATMAAEWAPGIWQDVEKTSVAMRTFRTINMGKREKIFPFLDVLPSTPAAGPFVNGDTGIKPTYNMAWANKQIVAEEIAGIVPIPENVIADSDIDVMAEVRPRIVTYVARSIDAAVFSGTWAPASWPTGGLVGVATDAGNVLDYSTWVGGGTQPQGYDLAGAFNELLGIVEDDGFDASRLYTKKAIRRLLRNMRDGDGRPVMQTSLAGSQAVTSIWDTPTEIMDNGILGGNVRAIAADPSYAIIGRRSDMEWKLLDQATLTQSITISGTTFRAVAASLAEQDMIGLRFKIRLGFSYMDPTTYEGGNGASPFAVMID